MSVYNGEKYLRETIDSVLSNLKDGYELIVVNDGSTDSSLNILEEYSREYSQVKLISHANVGLTRSLIEGCMRAKGKYIARQDIGDINIGDRFVKQAEMLEKNSETAMVYIDHILVDDAGHLMGKRNHDPSDIAESFVLKRDKLVAPHHGSVMFRSDLYHKVGGYRHQFYFAQDIDLWARLLVHGEIRRVPDCLYQARFTEDCISGIYAGQQKYLQSLVEESIKARMSGIGDEDILKRAEKIRPKNGINISPSGKAAAFYFMGGCLSGDDKKSAREYFLKAIQSNPLHYKAWYKYLRSFLV